MRLEQSFALSAWALTAVFCFLLSFVIFVDVDVYRHVVVGAVAPYDVVANVSFEMTDRSATEAQRRAAEDAVPPVYDYDDQAFARVIDRVYRAFRPLRAQIKSVRWPRRGSAREEAIKDFARFKPEFDKELGVVIPNHLFDWLTEKGFSAPTENIVIRSLVKWSAKKVADGLNELKPDAAADTANLLLVRANAALRAEDFLLRRKDVLDLTRGADFTFDGVSGSELLKPKDRATALEVSRALRVANLHLDRGETSRRRQAAREAVGSLDVLIKKGQTIIGAGTVVRADQLAVVAEMNRVRSSRRTDFASVVVATLLVIMLWVFASYHGRKVLGPIFGTREGYAVGTVILMIVAFLKLALFVIEMAPTGRGAWLPPNAWLFAVPIAAGPMLVGLMLGPAAVVWQFTVFLSVALAFMVDIQFDFVYLLFALIGGLAAARGVRSCARRSDLYGAGLRTGLVNAGVLVALTFLQSGPEGTTWLLLARQIPLGFFGGLLSSLVALALIPLFETVFNFTTDVRLLELASLNHPLMKSLVVKAPGTYHHSLIVGSMCEAAAEAVGANPLLAKVMAYYHDIGKIEHAPYFIENQRSNHNPHDHLSPNMSKTILIAHVKDGAELGRRFKLGAPILDGILQHHGTTLMAFFYRRALEKNGPDRTLVSEAEYRYPGPKPQFKEAALLMLADSIEAAARSMHEPNDGRLSLLVKNMIQSKFLDGQLEECDLTLRDLKIIEDSYRRSLLGIYHQRVDYAKATA